MASNSALPFRAGQAAWTAAIGIVLGTAYVLSPLTVWFAILVFALFLAVSRGVSEGERRWLFGMFWVAVGLRLLALAALFLVTDHTRLVGFFWEGDGIYLMQRASWIRDIWLGVPLVPGNFAHAFDRLYGWTTYLYVLAYLQYLMGPAPYAAHLFNVLVFLTMAATLYRLARSAYGPTAALLGLGLLLFLPTPFLWSVSALKESLYVMLAVLALVAGVILLRPHSRIPARALALAALLLSVAAIGGVRGGGALIVTAGLATGLAGSLVVRRASLVLLVLVLVPLAGFGLRASPGTQARIMSQLKTSAVLHLGNVRTEGHSYKLLDQRMYSAADTAAAVAAMTPGEGVRFVIRALVAFVVVPLPWRVESLPEIMIVPQQLAWYVLVVLALVGLAAGLRRDALVTSMFAGFSAAGAVAIALNSGNVGTMIRFRDTVIPFVVWLSAYGAVTLASSLASVGLASGPDRFDSKARAVCR